MKLWTRTEKNREKWGKPGTPDITSPIRLVEESKVVSVTEMALRLMAAGTMDEVQKIHGWYHGEKEDIIKNMVNAKIAPKYMSDNEIYHIGEETKKAINVYEERKNAKAKAEIEKAREEEIQRRVSEELAKKQGGNE